MSRVCEFTGAAPVSGNNVSHAQNKTKRLWRPNLQSKKFHIAPLNKTIKVTLSTQALKTITKKGGIVEALKQAKEDFLSDKLLKVKNQLQK